MAKASRPHARGEAIPLPMRVVHLTHDMEAIGRLYSPTRALEVARERRDRTYDPTLADLFVAHGARWFDRLASLDPWDAVLALEPEPRMTLDGAALDDALDRGSRLRRSQVAEYGRAQSAMRALSTDAARILGCGDGDRRHVASRRAPARLRHDGGAELDLGQARRTHAGRV